MEGLRHMEQCPQQDILNDERGRDDLQSLTFNGPIFQERHFKGHTSSLHFSRKAT